jgi:hypothetical protein
MAGQVFAGLGPDGGSYQMKYKPPWQAMSTIFAKMAVTGCPHRCGLRGPRT